MHPKNLSLDRARIALTAALLFALPAAANAAFIDFTGTVTGGGQGTTAPAPFDAGDPLSGALQIDDAAATAGSQFGVAALQSFDFTVGSVDFTLPDVTPFSLFSATVADDGASLSQFQITTSLGGTIPDCGSCSLNLSSQVLNASAPNSFTVQALGFPPGVAEGTLSNTVRATNNVPEPPTLLAYALGLALLGAGVRGRARYSIASAGLARSQVEAMGGACRRRLLRRAS